MIDIEGIIDAIWGLIPRNQERMAAEVMARYVGDFFYVAKDASELRDLALSQTDLVEP